MDSTPSHKHSQPLRYYQHITHHQSGIFCVCEARILPSIPLYLSNQVSSSLIYFLPVPSLPLVEVILIARLNIPPRYQVTAPLTFFPLRWGMWSRSREFVGAEIWLSSSDGLPLVSEYFFKYLHFPKLSRRMAQVPRTTRLHYSV